MKWSHFFNVSQTKGPVPHPTPQEKTQEEESDHTYLKDFWGTPMRIPIMWFEAHAFTWVGAEAVAVKAEGKHCHYQANHVAAGAGL